MTKTIMEPNSARLSAVVGKDIDAARGESPAQPHPDDWPSDISEPEFLELTQVYTGDEPGRGDAAAAPENVEPSPEHPVPGDDMHSYHSADDGAQDVIFAPDLTHDQPRAAHSPQDFIAEPEERLAPESAAAEGPAPPHPEHQAFAGATLEHEPAAPPHPAPPGAEAAPTAEDFERAYPAEKARQGRIVLDKPEKRALFVGGLVGTVIVVLTMVLFGV